MHCSGIGRRAALASTAMLGVLPGFVTRARAGEPSCSDAPPAVDSVVRAAAAARRLEQAIDASGAETSIVARVGSDLSRHGVTYTHAAIAWRGDPAGHWQVLHALNECGGRTSRVYRQGLMQFFLEQPVRYDALVLVPRPALRTALLARLSCGAALSLHQPLYSAVAYPFATAYQNSNQFVLENLALAHSGAMTGSRDTAIRHLRETGFQPHVVRFSGLERLSGSFKANVRFDDHPPSAARENRYAVVTVQAVERWLSATGLLASRVELL
jgi:hypothetical protein